MRALRLIALMLLVGAAHGCTLLMPSDDELRGERASGGTSGGGSGGTSGVSGGGGFPIGGSAGQGGAASKCSAGSDFTQIGVASTSAARAPLLAYRAAGSDLSLTFLEAGDVLTRGVALDGTAAAATQLSSSGKAAEVSAGFSVVAGAVGATWFDTTLSFGAHPPTTQKPVYGTDPTLPGGKSPLYAAIAGSPSSAGFGIIWNGYGDSARRLYALAVDASGANLTSGDGYTRITDEPQCGARAHQALITTTDGFAVAWSWAPDDCAAPKGGAPDIYFTTLDAGLAPPVSKLAVEASPGVSDFPALAFSGTDFGVVWQDNRDGANAVWFARIAGSSVVAGSLVRVSKDVPSANKAPSIAAGPSGYGVAWQSGNTVHLAIVGAGGPPSDAVLATDALPGETPSVVWAKDRWAVAWTRAGAKAEIQLSLCAP